MSPVFDIATRAMIVAYKAEGKSNSEITALTGTEKRTINRIYARAIERGFNPAERPIKLTDEHLKDAPRSGRPSKQQEDSEKVVDLVSCDLYRREMICADIAGDLCRNEFEKSAATLEGAQESWIQEEKTDTGT